MLGRLLLNVAALLSACSWAMGYTNIDRIAQLRTLHGGVTVNVTSPMVVTAESGTFTDGGIYIAQPDRAAGIKLIPNAGLETVALGDRIAFTGYVGVGDEPFVQVDSYTSHTTGAELSPLGVSGRSLAASGPTMTGQLARMCGKVIYKSPDGGFVYIDDGSGLNDGSGHAGLRVRFDGLTDQPTADFDVDQFALLTGLIGIEMVSGEAAPVLRPRGDADLGVDIHPWDLPATIDYQLPASPAPTKYRVTLAIARADNPSWIVRSLLSGEVVEVTQSNGGAFSVVWNGLDDDGFPVQPGSYIWKGIYMPAEVWSLDGKHHTFTAKLAVTAGSSICPQPYQDTMPIIYNGYSTSPMNDVWAMPGGNMLVSGEYIENGTNPLMIDPNMQGANQLVWGAASGGVAAVNACAADADYSYAAAGQGYDRPDGPEDLITRYSTSTGARLSFGGGDSIPIPLTPGGERDKIVSMAAQKTSSGNHYLYIPLLKANKLMVVNGTTGQTVTEVTGLMSPRGVRLDPMNPETALHVVCRGTGGVDTGGYVIARVPLSAGAPAGVATVAAALQYLDAASVASMGSVTDSIWNNERSSWAWFSQSLNTWDCLLQPAVGLAIDRDGNFYIGNQIVHQVWKYSHTGTRLLTIGLAGGQQAGQFQPTAMRCPQGIDIRYGQDGVGHLVVAERVPWQRVSQWSLGGAFERDWYISILSEPGVPDPENTQYVYVPYLAGTMRFIVDYANGTWSLDAVWPTQPGNPGDGVMYTGSARCRIYHIAGKTYLANATAQGSRYIYEVNGYQLIPRAAISDYLLKHYTDLKGINVTGVPMSNGIILAGPALDFYWQPWTWRDINGDGKDQIQELNLAYPPVISGYANKFDVVKAFRSYWGEYYDSDLNLLLPEEFGKGARYAIIPRTGWDARGNPTYAWSNFRVLMADDTLAAEGNSMNGFGGMVKASDGSYYCTEYYGPSSPGGIDHGADASFAKLVKFVPNGSGGYKVAWRVGQHARSLAQPGEMYWPGEISEPVNGLVGVHDYNGLFHLYTTDGLYVDTLLRDYWSHGAPYTIYDLGGEIWGARLYGNPADGQAYLTGGHRAASIFRVENLMTPGRVLPIPNSSGAFTLYASQISPAADWAVERLGQRKLAVVVPVHGAPALDGSLTGWSQAAGSTFSLDANRTVEVRVMFDQAYMYVRSHILTGGAPSLATEGNLFRCFTHDARADVFSFYIQGDSGADPNRVDGALGDVRFLMTLVSQPSGPARPAIVGMYRQYPGGGTHPMSYSSPVGTITYQEVAEVAGAQVGYSMDADGNGFTIAAAIPLTAIPGLSPHAGLVTAMDFDMVFGGTVRSWWSNTGTNPAATLMSDEYSEARMYPTIWGQAQFDDPTKFTLTDYSVVGPFGFAAMSANGADPHYVMSNLAQMTYPPQNGVDLSATYTGDITRDWKGGTHSLSWSQAQAEAGGWTRFDHAWGLSGEDCRGTGYVAAWVYAPAAVTVTANIEPHGTVYAYRTWIHNQELTRQYRPELSPDSYTIPVQQVQLNAGWNLVLLRIDHWGQNWLFENAGGWGFNVTLSGVESDIWSLRASSLPPN